MSVTGTLGHKVGSSPMAIAKPIVFVVDDDVSVRESLELLIDNEGWQPKTFASAQEFLGSPRAVVPSWLLLDISLPGLNGLELQKRVAVERTDMPIIFITGYGDVPKTVQAMKAGAAEFLTKPVRSSLLLPPLDETRERRTYSRSGKEISHDDFSGCECDGRERGACPSGRRDPTKAEQFWSRRRRATART